MGSRPRVKTDQLGDTCTYLYDLAGRLLEKQFAAAPGSPNLPDDGENDIFTYDAASRLLTATSQRYDNVVTYTWTDDGLIASESLTIPASAPGSGQTYTVQRGYDTDDRLRRVAVAFSFWGAEHPLRRMGCRSSSSRWLKLLWADKLWLQRRRAMPLEST